MSLRPEFKEVEIRAMEQRAEMLREFANDPIVITMRIADAALIAAALRLSLQSDDVGNSEVVSNRFVEMISRLRDKVESVDERLGILFESSIDQIEGPSPKSRGH